MQRRTRTRRPRFHSRVFRTGCNASLHMFIKTEIDGYHNNHKNEHQWRGSLTIENSQFSNFRSASFINGAETEQGRIWRWTPVRVGSAQAITQVPATCRAPDRCQREATMHAEHSHSSSVEQWQSCFLKQHGSNDDVYCDHNNGCGKSLLQRRPREASRESAAGKQSHNVPSERTE